jgi:hypothetical protein
VKKAKKEIMAMVMEGIKGDEQGTAKPKGTKAGQASETLLALVRGARKGLATSMLTVEKEKSKTDFVPSRGVPKVAAALMIPGQVTSARDYRPVNRGSSERTSSKGNDGSSSNVENDIYRTENDEVEKSKMTKTDPLSIKKGKRETLKNHRRQDPHFLCGDDCKFKAKGRNLTLTF